MKKLIRKTFQKFGLDIVKYNPQYTPEYSIVRLLEHFNISLFLDVGANTGQTGISLLENGYEGKIISFEPVNKAYQTLLKTSRKYQNWTVAERCALGDKNEITEINISQNLQSSSILPMHKEHIEADPSSKFIAKEKIKVYKVDTILPRYLKAKDRVFLKIDTQGYEEKILKGAKKILTQTTGLQIELSFSPLYKGEPAFAKMLKNLSQKGFEIYQIYPGFTNRKTGHLLQADVVFFRKTKTR